MEQALVFQVGNEYYGLEIENIQEVIESTSFHYIPTAPEAFSGAINFHGSIIPAIDLPMHIGEPKGPRDHRVIVLIPSLARIALATTAIHRVIPMEHDWLMPVQDENGTARYIRGAFSHNNMMVNLLDVVRLLEDLQNI